MAESIELNFVPRAVTGRHTLPERGVELMVSAADKLKRIEALWWRCKGCALSNSRKCVVFTRGNPESTLGIIGEAPGELEDRSGVPFIGRAGDILDRMCDRAGVEPWDALIFNAVGCRPPMNEKPSFKQILACRPRLASIIAAFRPRALLLLGATALSAVTAYSRVSDWRGKQIKAGVPWRGGLIELDAIVTYHPVFVARAPDDKLERMVIDDIRKARELSSTGSWVERDE